MILGQSKTQRFESFLERIKRETYPEPPSKLHTIITRKMIDELLNKYSLSEYKRILDVGCGQGVALEYFESKGFSPIGITLNKEDFSICKQKGYEVYEMDQSFLDFNDEEFDLIWCRHCLEHSVFPYLTLIEFFRVLKHKGYLYIEAPAPDTSCKHQTNQNHYSVLNKSMWEELIRRTGFDILDAKEIRFRVQPGDDLYWAFTQQKM